MSDNGSAPAAVTDPIVISGMAVEAPGGIDTPGALWSALAESRELLCPFPRDRGWPVDDLLSPSRLKDGWRQVRDSGGFLDGAAQFDPGFFGLTHHEAMATHPQQRVALRVAWKALENAGINPGALEGSEVGCFVGMSMTEYGTRTAVADDYTGFRTVGMGQLGGAGRISHCLGITGPSISLDSACASSLTAVQLAANAVQMDECEWALAGAVCVLGAPAAFYEFSRLNALSADGHCRAYSDDATGTVWGEGAGMVVVERESRARQLGHRIYGRILAIRTNHNGKGKPILVPRTRAQANAGSQNHRRGRNRSGRHRNDRRARHRDPGRRPAGIDRAVQDLRRGGIPGATGLDQVERRTRAGCVRNARADQAAARGPARPHSPNPVRGQPDKDGGLGHRPAFDWPPKLHPWEPKDGVRYGAASSFGAGGANAHAIIAMPEGSGA